MTVAASKDYRDVQNTAPHPAAFCVTATPSDSTVLGKSTRWVMITDTTAKALSLRLGGVTLTSTALVGVSGDISAAAAGVYNSTTSNKFSTLNVGDPVTIKGFSTPQNNGTFVVSAVSGTQITVTAPGSILPPNTAAETPSGALVSIQGPPISSQATITFTALPGVMYPICADKVLATGTVAASVLCLF